MVPGPMNTAPELVPTPAPKKITLPIFEGPLDLLLHLVKVDELDPVELPIAEITRQYIEHLEAMAELDLEIAGEFLVMAATLLNIKLRSILPKPPEEIARADEEEIDEILSTQDLVRRLVEYRRFKQMAQALREREEENAGIYCRTAPVLTIPGAEQELPRQDILKLFDAFVTVLKRVRTKPEHRVAAERFTVEDKLSEVRELLRRERNVNLSRTFERCVDKEEVICYFLAILELARMREITVGQADTFEDILIEPWDESLVYVG